MSDLFKERSLELERLDTGDYTPREYAKWQAEMRFIHRIFGEARALRGSLMPDLRSDDLDKVSILDVGAGSGELLRIVRKWTRNRNTFLVGAELSEQAAKSIKDGSPNKEIVSVRCDALDLPFDDSSFDYVFCSLFLHHLTEEKGIELLKEMDRVARRRFYVVDLHRHPRAYKFYKLISRFFLQPFTQEDGALSILRSYTPEELRKLAKNAGLEDFEVSESRAYRLVLAGRITRP